LDISLATANAAALCRHFAKVRASRVEVHGRGSGDTTAALHPSDEVVAILDTEVFIVSESE